MNGFFLRSWQLSASAPAAVGFLWVRVRWGKAPENVALKAIVKMVNYAQDFMTVVMMMMTTNSNGSTSPAAFKIFGDTKPKQTTWERPGLTSCRLEQDLRPPPLCNCDLG